MRQPGCPQRLSGPGISSAFQAQITQANPFLQHWLMTEVRCSLLIGWWRLHSIVLNKEEAEGQGGRCGGGVRSLRAVLTHTHMHACVCDVCDGNPT